MKQTLKSIIIDYLNSRLDREEVVCSLIRNQIPIDTYNSVLINIIKRIRKMISRLTVRRKSLSLRRYASELSGPAVVNNRPVALETSEAQVFFNKMQVMPPQLFCENKRMLTEAEIQSKLQVFAEHFKIQVRDSKEIFQILRWGCREFLKRELNKIRKSDK